MIHIHLPFLLPENKLITSCFPSPITYLTYSDPNGESLLHIAAREGYSEIVMILLSILWRQSLLFSGYPDLMHVNQKGEDAAEVAADTSLRSLVRACIDRYSVVNVNNLKQTDTLAGKLCEYSSFA